MEDYLTAEEALILTKKAQKKICKMKLPEILDEVKNAAMDGNVRVSIEGKVRPYINDRLIKLGYSLRVWEGMLDDELYTEISWYPNENEISREVDDGKGFHI